MLPAHGYTDEGSEGWCSETPVAGTTALYRYFKAADWDHALTITAGDLGDGYVYEATLCYVWTAESFVFCILYFVLCTFSQF